MGRLFILSSPSGGGKTTVGDRLKRVSGLVRTISVTTRRARRGEKEGRDYFFVSKRQFDRMKRRGELLEWTTYYGHSYGTPKAWVEERLAEGKDLLLLLDVRGALALKRRLKRVTTIFLLPPSFETLVSRLGRRRTESRKEIAKRLQIAKKELAFVNHYDHVVVNAKLGVAVKAIQRIILATRRKK